MVMCRHAISSVSCFSPSEALKRDIYSCRRSTMLKSYRKILAQIQHSQSYGLGYIVRSHPIEEHPRQLSVHPHTDSREVVCFPTSRLHGYEFSNQGLLGLWKEPLDARHLSDHFVYGNFAAAALRARRTGSERPWKAPVRTNKLEQRRFALHLCEWGVGEDELNHAI